MERVQFQAYVLANEFDLNKVAAALGLPRKYTWEEPLVMKGSLLDPLLQPGWPSGCAVYIFSFGSIVFVNARPEDEAAVLSWLRLRIGRMNWDDTRQFRDTYELLTGPLQADEKAADSLQEAAGTNDSPGAAAAAARFESWPETAHDRAGANDTPGAEPAAARSEEITEPASGEADTERLPVLTDKYVLVTKAQPYHQDLIAMVVAKSVALEKIELRLAEIMDNIEPLIVRLEKGKLRVSDRRLAQISSRIARYEYNALAYVMLLDKPDITWTSSDALLFYDQLADFFELNDRYEVLTQKAALLNRVVDGIAAISHSLKNVRIEVVILLLILIEVIIMVIDLLPR